MNAFKKTMLASAVLMSMGAGAVQAATITDFSFAGSFLMYDGTDPANSAQFNASSVYIGPLGNGSFSNFTSPTGIMDNNNGMAGDPISGMMHIDMSNGSGTATMTGTPFFGDSWTANNVTLTGIGPGLEHATMLFNWGAADPTTSCGLINCDIHVAVNFQMMGMPDANGNVGFVTVASWMLDGPFAGAQPTFSGTAHVEGQHVEGPVSGVPVPAAAWLLGSGLLGLVGVARRKAA